MILYIIPLNWEISHQRAAGERDELEVPLSAEPLSVLRPLIPRHVRGGQDTESGSVISECVNVPLKYFRGPPEVPVLHQEIPNIVNGDYSFTSNGISAFLTIKSLPTCRGLFCLPAWSVSARVCNRMWGRVTLQKSKGGYTMTTGVIAWEKYKSEIKQKNMSVEKLWQSMSVLVMDLAEEETLHIFKNLNIAISL